MNNELSRIGWNSIPPELLHEKILLISGSRVQIIWQCLGVIRLKKMYNNKKKLLKNYYTTEQNSNELIAVELWTDGAYFMSTRFFILACPTEISIAIESEALQLWHERLSHQYKRHVWKLLKTGTFIWVM